MARSLLKLLVLLTTVTLVLLPRAADARLTRLWGVEHIARDADAVAVGQVVRVSVVGRLAPGQTSWRLPLLQKSAAIRVLRAFSAPGKPRLREGETISLGYLALDEQGDGRFFEPPLFPVLAVGDVYAVPLRRAGPPQPDTWELLDQEGAALLVPCVRQPLGRSQPGTATTFLESELAGTFALGGYADIFKAALYANHSPDPQVLGAVHNLIAQHVGNDQTRWLDIAVASYCASGTPRPTIAQLLAAGSDVTPTRMAFVAKALGHVTGRDLKARFLNVAMQHASLHPGGTGETISQNYSPAAFQLMKDALQHDAPESLYLARFVIPDKAPPLIPEVVAAARRVLLRSGKTPDPNLGIAGGLIREYGDDHAFALALDEIRKAQKRDLARYWTLLGSSFAYGRGDQRSIRVCAIMIQDRRVVVQDARARSRGIRYCDKAAYDLQKVAGVDFGFRSADPVAKRDHAIGTAKAWLAQHVPASH